MLAGENRCLHSTFITTHTVVWKTSLVVLACFQYNYNITTHPLTELDRLTAQTSEVRGCPVCYFLSAAPRPQKTTGTQVPCTYGAAG